MVLKTVAANNERQAAEGMGGIIFRTAGIRGATAYTKHQKVVDLSVERCW